MYKLIRKVLFAFDPEAVHHFSFKSIRTLLKLPGIKALWKKQYIIENKELERNVMGLKFKNPVGVAAGFDKDAKLYEELAYCGFGFVEIGTVTPLPQSGNPKKRLFRLKKDQAIINRMGFNNEGVDAAVQRLKKRKSFDLIIGGNIGKNKVTPNEKAIDDYVICFEKLVNYVDYFVVNVSSPNTPNLRALQDKEPLTKLLKTLMQKNKEKTSPKPILLKIAPDLNNSQLDDIIEIVAETKIDGIIATNTTISREGLKTTEEEINTIGAGGLSGLPLNKRSTEVIRYLRTHTKNEKLVIIGVGGIHSAKIAQEKIDAGADLVQLYTGFVYEGPKLVSNINQSLLDLKKSN